MNAWDHPHQNFEDSILLTFFRRLIDIFDSVYLPSLLSMFITIFF